MIHILRYGLPLCRFTANTPADWPTGHKWIHFPDPTNKAKCSVCKRVLPREKFSKTDVDKVKREGSVHSYAAKEGTRFKAGR